MSDYISREAAIETVTNYCVNHDLRDLLADIEVIPAADVVEVVRCKDCKRHTDNCFCEHWQSVGAVAQMESDDFCSYAERREP